ncbi:S41 family peptidase [Candidatus Saccharibacteria bacterium]|nr:S41 family peptidase [Candidatus Saccharibacteria bacterium]
MGDSKLTTEKSTRFWKYGLVVFISFLIFSFGYGLGSGNIKFGTKSSDGKLPANLSYQSVEEVYDSLRTQYDGELDEISLLSGLKKGLVEAAGDPYTEFLTAEQTQEFDEDLNGTFSGIGAELSKKDDSIVIVSPINGFPAEREGLKPNDVILEIDGESAYGLSVSEAVDKIRGQVGTQVQLKVLREDGDKSFTITRENITIPSVESKVIDGNIGYIEISRFSDDTAELVRSAAEDFKSQNVKGVIVDVRGNPGGLLDAAVDVSSVWLDKGDVVLEEKSGDKTIRTYNANGNSILGGIPTVVLINEGSASASEILAGALNDNGAATLIGQKSFGKGSVQTIERFSDGSSLKVTIARWYTPNGNNIDKQGIEPNTAIEQSENPDVDSQLQAAIDSL